ncbi:hypothetical protein PAAL109150_14210 [Paenibacillus alkaliterrae]
MIYICKIELDDIAPGIWRKFQFHPDSQLQYHLLYIVNYITKETASKMPAVKFN